MDTTTGYIAIIICWVIIMALLFTEWSIIESKKAITEKQDIIIAKQDAIMKKLIEIKLR